ncbi:MULTISPECIES: hypothetical protein [Bacillus]|uniref:hypothetical protein n=1 Tax=Bacillus TaxID=1386 RepID=UPI0035BEBA9A
MSSVWAGGHKFLYYAEDGFGHIWAGNYFTQIPAYAFDWCWNMGSTDSRTLGLKMTDEISSTSQDYKITINV